MSAGGHGMALGVVLGRVAGELGRLHAAGQVIEDIVGEQIRRAGMPAGVMHPALQNLDALVQSIDGIALFLQHLSVEVDGATLVDPGNAARLVPMRELGQALVGGAHPVEDGTGTDSYGQVHLF